MRERSILDKCAVDSSATNHPPEIRLHFCFLSPTPVRSANKREDTRAGILIFVYANVDLADAFVRCRPDLQLRNSAVGTHKCG